MFSLKKTAKYVTLSVFFYLCQPILLAQNLFEIEDKLNQIQSALDDIEINQMLREISTIDSSNKNTKRKKGIEIVLSGSEKIINSSVDEKIYLRTTSLEVIRSNFVLYTLIAEYSKPQYANGVPHFAKIERNLVDCKNRQGQTMMQLLFDSDLQKVSEKKEVGKFQKINLVDKAALKVFDYVCSGINKTLISHVTPDYVRSVSEDSIHKDANGVLTYWIDIEFSKPKKHKGREFISEMSMMTASCERRVGFEAQILLRDNKWNIIDRREGEMKPFNFDKSSLSTRTEFNFVCERMR